VELATTEAEQAYGLMERSSLPEGRGMLFVNEQAGLHSFWMYHCKIALDIVWMDAAHRVVEIAADTPPLPGKDQHLSQRRGPCRGGICSGTAGRFGPQARH
jgi:uncharacterized membrane protein (UPF0127 family)